MAIPLLNYAPKTQNARVVDYEVGGDEQPTVYTTAFLPSGISLDLLIEAAYRQIFFSAFKSDRQKILETKLRNGEITTRDFIRGLLLSKTYQQNIFDKNSNYGVVEQTVRRILGRDVYSEQEKIAWSIVIVTKGFAGFVDDLLNSDEYLDNFGYDTVPYQRRRVLPGRALGEVPFNIKTFGDKRGTGKTLPFPEIVRQNTQKVKKTAGGSNLPLLEYAPSAPNVRVKDITLGGDETPKVFTTENIPFAARTVRDGKPKVFNGVTVASSNDLNQVVEAAYRQLFFTAFKSDRQPTLESQLRNGDITTRDFIRGLLLSETYKNSFYDKNSNYRFVELTVEKVLGRRVYSEREKIAWSIVVVNEGIAGFADKLLNSDEYLENFGYDTVPYQRRRVIFGRAAGEPPVGMAPRYDAYYRKVVGFPQIVWQNEVRTYTPQDKKPKTGDPSLYQDIARGLNLPPIKSPKGDPANLDYLSLVPRR